MARRIGSQYRSDGIIVICLLISPEFLLYSISALRAGVVTAGE
jgi:hypothetical protein